MRAKKIVNQSSDFQVRRTGSYHHKKSTGCDNKLQCHGSAYRSHSDLVVDVLFCDVLLAETGILSIAFCETVDICGVQCVPCLLSSAVLTEHFLSTVFFCIMYYQVVMEITEGLTAFEVLAFYTI